MSHYKTLKATVVTFFTAVGLAGWAHAADPGVTDEEIRIGAIMPFTGPAGALGYAAMLGEKIAVEEANADGGVNGRMINFIAEDDEYVPARTVQAFQKLMESDEIFALAAGSGSSHWLAIMPTLEAEGIPNINPLLASMKPFEAGPNTHFGIGTSYRDGAYEVMKVMNEEYPGLKWASIVQEDESGLDREAGFNTATKEMGLEVVFQARVDRSQTDFSAEVLRMQAAGATGIFIGGLPTVDAGVLQEVKRLGMDAKVATLWLSHNAASLDLMGHMAENLVLYDFVPSMNDPKLDGFHEAAKAYLSEENQRRLNRYSVTGYATMKAFIEAMRRCGEDLTRACTLEQLNSLENFDTGPMGEITWSEDQHLAPVQGGAIVIDQKTMTFMPLN